MLFHFGSDRLEPSLYRRKAGVKRNEAVSMFGSLKDLISSLVEDARPQGRAKAQIRRT